MGFFASLLPGVRDLRTPLAAGYVWLLSLWLILHDVFFARTTATNLADAVQPLTDQFRVVAAGVAVTAVAYLIGSLLVVDMTHVGLGNLGWLLSWRLEPGLVRNALRLTPNGRAYLRPGIALPPSLEEQLLQVTDVTRLRLVDVFSLCNLRTDRDLVELARSYRYGRQYWRAVEGIDVEEYLEEAVGKGAQSAIGAFDPGSLSVRLHIANAAVWDQYDRLVGEAEFRATLTLPLVFLSLGLALNGAAWLGLVVLLFTVLMYRVGEVKARSANRVLVQALVTGLIKDPALAPSLTASGGQDVAE